MVCSASLWDVFGTLNVLNGRWEAFEVDVLIARRWLFGKPSVFCRALKGF